MQAPRGTAEPAVRRCRSSLQTHLTNRVEQPFTAAKRITFTRAGRRLGSRNVYLEGRAWMCHIRHMRNITIRKLHEETGRIVDAAQAGEVIIVRRRGVAVAELRAVTPANLKVRIPDFNRRYAKFPRVTIDSGRIQEEDRR
jgi:antitoxin (DNA-binding transcriptional repressor) of toxin-antitoxin stability system